MSVDRQKRGNQRCYKVEKVEENEAQEVFVILVAQTIVYKGTVMIEFLHTSLAMSAVESATGFDYSAIEAEIIQIYTLFIGKPQKFYDLEFLSDISRFDKTCYEVKYHGEKKENICCYAPISKSLVKLLYIIHETSEL